MRNRCALLLCAALSCRSQPTAAPPPACAERPAREADLARVTLTPEAERRLDIPDHLGTITRRTVRRARALGCRTLHGGGMAVFQAVEAFRLFSGVPPDAERMLAHFRAMGA